MATPFSFSEMLNRLDEQTDLTRPADAPTESHMRSVMHAYIENINNPAPDFQAVHFAAHVTGEDPVGATSPHHREDEHVEGALRGLIDVPFTPQKAELVAPVRFSVGNKAAMAFKFWATVDGRDITIDIIDVMTFDADGRICDIRAYWGMDNVTVLS